MAYLLGIDIGTSGCRAIAIDVSRSIIARCHQPLPPPTRVGANFTQEPSIWWESLEKTLDAVCRQLDPGKIKAISLDATSSTLLVTNSAGSPLGPALMYNDCSCTSEADRIASLAPADSIARGASSSLSKLLHLYAQHPNAHKALHQADWLLGRLCGRFDITDENNALKLGFNPVDRNWPDWIRQLELPDRLFPMVLEPGTAYATLATELAVRWGMPLDTMICTGTTDSTAAFLATGATSIGDAVTSLGSSMVLKVISDKPVFAPQFGVYSHRLGDLWLAGGASNTGGAALLQYFTTDEMDTMSKHLDLDHPTGIDMYPLPSTGERFPYNDPEMPPRIPAFPTGDEKEKLRFFQGMLESIARIEKESYRLLEKLGAPYPSNVRSVGGGSYNTAWTRIRANYLGVPMLPVEHSDAAYGTALLALRAYQKKSVTPRQ